jgi:hypothetical protein
MCSQAVGAKNFHLAGQWLQLALVTVTLLTLTVATPLFFTDDIVACVSNDTTLVEYSLVFNIFSLAALLPQVLYMTIRQFFQAINVVLPETIVTVLGIAFNIGANEFYIHGVVPDSGITNESNAVGASYGYFNTSNTSKETSASASAAAAALVSPLAFLGLRRGLGGTTAASPLAMPGLSLQDSSLGFHDPNRTHWPWFVHCSSPSLILLDAARVCRMGVCVCVQARSRPCVRWCAAV